MSKKFIENLELLQADGNIILFAWSVLRTSIEETDESLDYCNLVTSDLIKKDIFGALYKLIVHEMYKVIRYIAFFSTTIQLFFRILLQETWLWTLFLN